MAEFDIPIILIVFVVISAIKWFMEKVKNQGEQPHETSESLEDIYENFREEIKQRQTTVHQPEATPPPLPQRQTQARAQAPTPRRQQVSPPPPIQVSAPIPKKKTTLSDEQKAAAARFEQLTSHKNTHRRNTGAKGSIRSLLSNPQSTKQAMVLLEVLGKPKSMQQG